ncbi:MAG: tRNA lysidine(34) synthetase TilS [Thermoguttaceae bacterium]|nr:tRNA lysidine(34) synthetase TilS [Thermoguttaceae bacterium]
MTLNDFENVLLGSFPLEQWAKRRVCLATSGGADSVAALRALARVAERAGVSNNLFVVTIDHRSRGSESDGDVLFVRDLSNRLHIDFFARQIDPNELQQESKRQGSWESAARLLRYRLLFETARQNGARFLVTAHHNDDQLETLLFRIFRGSGLDGLRGIAPYRVVDESLTIVRPLLNLNRADILDYLEKLGQPYRTDSSNALPTYARNRIRNELIPILETLFPGKWQNSLLRLAQLANETESYFDKRVEELAQEVNLAQKRENAYVETLNKLHAEPVQNENKSDDYVDLPRAQLQNVPEEIVVRLLRKIWKERGWALGEMGIEEWRRLTQAATSGTPTCQLPDAIFVSFPNESTVRLELKRKERP